MNTKYCINTNVKARSVAVIAVLDEKVAPRWRCHLVRSIIAEHEPAVMLEVARWFPVMVHQLKRAGGQQLVGEVLGSVLHSPDLVVVQAGAASLRHLLCALLSLTSLKPIEIDDEALDPGILYCRLCNSPSSSLEAQKVDPTLVSRFLDLVSHSEVGIILAIIDGLPAVMSHVSVSPQMLQQYLSLLLHENRKVVTAIAKQLPRIVLPHEQITNAGGVTKEGEAVISYLEDLMKDCSPSNPVSSRIYYAIVEALQYLVGCPVSGLVGKLLILLLQCQASSDRMVTAKSHLAVHKLSDTVGLKLMDLYTRHRQSLAQVLVDMLKVGEVGTFLSHTAEIFEWTNNGNKSKRY
ncbi:hypothetical protein SK128_004452 [Halocaridina rubra]|uniref:Uncharacterized protein n=1 Tax=Halocaridina rubra TaxID=373956 RepID=A0AAN9FUG5_HALRR